jgi:hypothetical protein
MPAQQRRRRYHESVSAPMREQPRERGDERTIGRTKPRTLPLTGQDGDLVSKQRELHVLGELGPPTADEQPQNSSEGNVSEGEEHRVILPGTAKALTPDSPLHGSAVSGNRARASASKKPPQ